MHLPHFARRPMLALAAMSMVLTACSGSTEPDAPFDPAGTTADVESTLNAFDSPIVASYGSISEQVNGVIGGGVNPAVAVSPRSLATKAGAIQFAKRFMAKFKARTGTSAGNGPAFATSSIPSEYAGKTFEYDIGTQTYVAGERSGAPSNGVRFILYELNPETGLPDASLTELGYVQLTATESGTSQSARLTVVATPSNITYFDYSLTLTYTSTSANIAASGFVTNGTDRVNFNFSARITSSDQVILNYTFSAPTSGFRLDLSATLNFGTTLSGSFSITARGPHGRVNIIGTADENSESYTVRVNGDLFATITVTETTTTFVGADNEPLDSDELTALQHLYVLMSGGVTFFDGLIGLFAF